MIATTIPLSFVVFNRKKPPEPGYYFVRYCDAHDGRALVMAAEWIDNRWVPWGPDKPPGDVTHYARVPDGRTL